MIYLIIILFSIVQGLTEFLPVSSSGHLVILHALFPVAAIDSLGFDVALHLGTLIALIIYFYRDIAKYLAGFVSTVNHGWSNVQDRKIAWYLIVSTIPAVITVLLFEDWTEVILRTVPVVVVALVIGSIFMLLVEKYGSKLLSMESLNLSRTILIGCAQALALIPGVSRSGATIVGGMALGLKREEAARFSFLMAIPIVFLAGSKKSYDFITAGFVSQELIYFGLGIFVSAIIGYITIKYFLKFLANHSLNFFAWYRIVLATIVLIWYMI